MNTHPTSLGLALHRFRRTVMAAAAALVMISTLLAVPAAADNHFRPLDAWNNYWEGATDGLFVRWSAPIAGNPPGGPGGYTIHQAADCSDPAIATGSGNFWVPGRPTIRDVSFDNWASIQQGQTYYLRVARGTERTVVDDAFVYNELECFAFVAEVRAGLSGQVRDAETNAGLADATVTVFDENGGQVAQQTTVATSPNLAELGRYTIEGLDPGTYTVTAQASGYQSQSQTVTIEAGHTPGVNFSLQPGEDPDPDAGPTIVEAFNNAPFNNGLYVTWTDPITHPSAGPISGYRVYEAADCTGTPLAVGSQAFWRSARPNVRDISFDGWSLLAEGGTYYLSVAPGTERSSETDNLNPEQCFEFVNVPRPQETGTVAGQVSDAAGQGIAGATVTVGDRSATTDASGSFTVTEVPAGEHTVTVTAAGFQEASQAATVTAGETTTVDFTLQADEPGGLQCGDVITEDTTLTEDLGPCPGHGLIIGANNVTLDLAGFSIIGDPAARSGGELMQGSRDRAGVLFRQSTGSTVTGGTVRGFDAGVAIMGGGDNVVHFMNLEDNINYRVVTGEDADPDPDTPSCLFGEGVAVFNSSGNRIEDNQLANNGPLSGIALVGNSDNNQLLRNTLTDHDVRNATPDGRLTICGTGAGQGPMTRGRAIQSIGIRIEGPGAEGNLVEDNTVTRSAIAGIAIHGYVCAQAPNNGNNTINRNTVTQTGLNTSGEDPLADGIAILQQGPAGTVCVSHSNTITNNTSTGNMRDGIFVGGRGTHDNVINDNVVDDNARNGITLTGPTSTSDFTNVGPTEFDVVSPDRDPYTQGTDYRVMPGSGSGDVTGELVAIDIAIPSDDPVNPNPVDTSTSACQMADFEQAGFQEGDVALIQRGTCTFVEKVDNAIAAGASAVVMFNEGQEGRTSSDFGSVGGVGIPVLSASYAVGQELYALTQAGEVIVHILTNTENVITEIPGAVDNTLHRNSGHGNGTFDGADFNPDCDNNDWQDNDFGTVNQPCVAAQQQPETGTVTGRVTNASGEGVAGATVTVDGQTVTTDAAGNFTVEDLEPGDHTVTVTAAGFQEASQTATVTAGETTTVNFTLQAHEPDPGPRDPQTKDECKKGGWRQYGFKNQGQCIRYMNTSADSRP